MLTGCRCGEFPRLRWLRFRDSKKGPRTVPLSPPAARVLSNRLCVPGTPWVIPGSNAGHHMKTIDLPWRKVGTQTGLDDVRLHDLRHSFASRALALGESLVVKRKAVRAY